MSASDAPPLVARRLPFGDLGGFPDLFRRYAKGDPAALRFFARDWTDAGSRASAAADAAALGRDRETLADVLAEQNQAWGSLDAAVRAHIEALRDPDSAAVVTGQQLGLFGGPLYTVYKAATAVRLARRLADETGRPVVPVFWLAGEDHDFDEVRATLLLSGNDPARIELPASDDRTPVGRRVLGDEIGAATDALEAALRPTEFTERLMAAVRDAYGPGQTMRDAFAALMQHLFAGTGLVFISPDDARLKRLGADVFRQEIERWAETLERLESASAALDDAGFHRQVTPLPVNLFLMEDEGRFTLDPDGDGFALRGLGRRYAKGDLLALLDAEPERFSPNVVLRPVLEARLLPTAAYVAGPGEASYYAQLRGVYDLFDVPMPVVFPRASLTLVEGKVQKILERYGLTVADLGGDLEALWQRVALDRSAHDLDGAFGEAASHIHQAVNALKPVVAGVDPTLGKSAEATRAGLQKELDALKDRAVRAEKRNHEVVRDQLGKAAAGLYPTGGLQERTLSALYFLNKYGPDLVARWLGGLSLDTSEHQVLEL